MKEKIRRVWHSMIRRCHNIKDTGYKHYGDKGISVCTEWRDDFNTFYNWAMSNGYKEGLTIDRINNDGNYEPNNCRWVSHKENNNNRGDSYQNRVTTDEIKDIVNSYKSGAAPSSIARRYKLSRETIIKIYNTYNLVR